MPTTNQPAPTSPDASGQPKARKPTRAERRLTNQLARAKADVEAQALADNPFLKPAARRALDVGIPTPTAPGVSVPENQAAPASPPVQGHQPPQRGETQTQEGESRGAGRPSEFTWDEAYVLCSWVQAGGSLRGYAEKYGRSVSTVYRWMRENAQFQSLYAQAHEDRADTLTDEMIEIADDAAVAATIEDVAAAKLRVDTRKWIASKLRPQKWGEKAVVEHKGAVSIRIGITPKTGATALPMADVVDVIATQPAQMLLPSSD
jgi:transposase